MSNPIVGTSEVAVLMNRDLTAKEEIRADGLCDSVVATLELFLHRWLYEREVLTERHRTGPQGRVILFRAPVVSIEGVHYGTRTADPDPFPDVYDWEEPGSFRSNSVVWVDYTAGDDFPNVWWAAAAIDLCANAVARVILSPVQVSTGVIESYHVEGTSLTYGSAATGAGSRWSSARAGRLSTGDLEALKSLKIPVIR